MERNLRAMNTMNYQSCFKRSAAGGQETLVIVADFHSFTCSVFPRKTNIEHVELFYSYDVVRFKEAVIFFFQRGGNSFML